MYNEEDIRHLCTQDITYLRAQKVLAEGKVSRIRTEESEDGEEAFIQVFCDQMEIPYEKLTSAEFTAFLGILRKSKKAKRTKSMRGKGSPIPPNRNGRQKR